MARWSRFANLFRQRPLEAEFDEELRFHLEMRIERNLARGMAPAAAEDEARRHLGSALRAKEGMREARIMLWIETWLRDLAYGARLFRRQPAAAALAVLTLSLGIGANTVIYSLLHAALLSPLPFPDPDRLVAVEDHFRVGAAGPTPPTIPELLDVRAAARTLETVSFFDVRDAQINGGTEPARAVSARIEAGFFRALGVQPALGRSFTPEDHDQQHQLLVILSDRLWRRTFAADPGIINRDVVVNGQAHTVVGVLPPGVSFDYFMAEPIELYVLYTMSPLYTLRSGEYANVRRVMAIARVAPEATVAQAAAEVETVGRRILADHPELYRRGSDGQELGFSMSVRPLREVVSGNGRATLLLLFGAVSLVLLIACVNTAQFLLARAVERHTEVVIRTALGAGSGRLIRQFLTEASLLAVLAAALGLLQARWAIEVLRAAWASPSPLAQQFTLNANVAAFTVAVTVAVTVLCGMLPAMHVVRRRFVADASRLAGTMRSRTRHAMIAVQVAVSVVLLVSAGLLAQGLWQLQSAPRGYEADNVTVMRMRIAGSAAVGAGTGPTYQQYLSRVAAVPGVTYAAMADAPLPGSAGSEFSIVGRPDDAATLAVQRASWRIISGDYFKVLGVPILAGRAFDDRDAANATQAVIINEEMARRFWPGQDPIGQQVRSGEGPRRRVATIVGIVTNVRPPHMLDVVPQIYTSYLQQSEPSINLMYRAAAGTTVSVDAVKQAVWTAVPSQPLFDIQPLSAVIERRMTEARLLTWLLATLATLALLMSSLGVYTIVSYLTASRTKEVAVRRAMGASSREVLRLLGLPTLQWTGFGVIAGIAAAAGVANALSAVAPSFNMPASATQFTPSTAVVTAAVYVVIVAGAVLVPAARALSVEPGSVLRAE